MKYRRTVYETSKQDLAKVVTNFAKKKMPGRGFSCLMIGGTLQSGEKEVLELRFHTDFIPHVEQLLEQLNKLKDYEVETTKDMLVEVEEKVGGLEPPSIQKKGHHPASKEPSEGNGSLIDMSEDEVNKIRGLIDQMDKAVHREDKEAAQEALDKLRAEAEEVLNSDDLWDTGDLADELIDETEPDSEEEEGDDDIVDSTS